ncbi:MAG TPA: GxxExxY protein, partial [Kofleriaceae bacterium]
MNTAPTESAESPTTTASIAPIDEALNELSHRVIGAAMAVHRYFGPGHFESVYERALRIELELQNIPFRAQPAVTVTYKGVCVGEFVPDLIVDGRLIVELKAASSISDAHVGQALAYLRLTKLRLALVLNFHAPLLKTNGIRRV